MSTVRRWLCGCAAALLAVATGLPPIANAETMLITGGAVY